eukprot:scaffold2296_cov123-Skeletonema_marinoi.AAC.1
MMQRPNMKAPNVKGEKQKQIRSRRPPNHPLHGKLSLQQIMWMRLLQNSSRPHFVHVPNVDRLHCGKSFLQLSKENHSSP